MVTHLHDNKVSTCDESADVEPAQPDEHASPPPILTQVIASIHESRAEPTELLGLLVTNSSHGDATVSNARDQA
jgi:hypothetical protein